MSISSEAKTMFLKLVENISQILFVKGLNSPFAVRILFFLKVNIFIFKKYLTGLQKNV